MKTLDQSMFDYYTLPTMADVKMSRRVYHYIIANKVDDDRLYDLTCEIDAKSS